MQRQRRLDACVHERLEIQSANHRTHQHRAIREEAALRALAEARVYALRLQGAQAHVRVAPPACERVGAVLRLGGVGVNDEGARLLGGDAAPHGALLLEWATHSGTSMETKGLEPRTTHTFAQAAVSKSTLRSS